MSKKAKHGSSKSNDKSGKKDHKFFAAFDKLQVMSGDQLLSTKHPPTQKHWGRHVVGGSLGMVYGTRGAGKTHFITGMAVAMASGEKFLGLGPKKARTVLILDGEMGTKLFKKRLEETRKSLKVDSIKNLKIFCPDMFKHVMPSLADANGQECIDELITEDIDVVIVDNYSAWNRGGREDADGWGPWGEWMLKHKHLGRAVILVHHANKSGGQRGTSRKEDALDFVIRLEATKHPEHTDALSFNLEWEKSRSEGKADTKPMRVTRIERKEKPPKWDHEIIQTKDERQAMAADLRSKKMSLAAIGKQMGIDKSNVSRLLKGVKT